MKTQVYFDFFYISFGGILFIYKFQILGFFIQKNEYFWKYGRFVVIFGGSLLNWTSSFLSVLKSTIF